MRFVGPERVVVTTTQALELVDVTDRLGEIAAGSGLDDGVLHLWCPHTSCGLTVTELDDGLHRDIERALERLAPRDAHYDHDDLDRRTQNIEPDERRNGWSHVRHLVAASPTLTVPVAAGRLALGQWQRVFL